MLFTAHEKAHHNKKWKTFCSDRTKLLRYCDLFTDIFRLTVRAKMSLTVTIHEGELRQIKQHVAEKRMESGHLFGLWTHSNQPVVQYITGSLKDEDEEELFKLHALRRVGIWSTKESDGKKRNSVSY